MRFCRPGPWIFSSAVIGERSPPLLFKANDPLPLSRRKGRWQVQESGGVLPLEASKGQLWDPVDPQEAAFLKLGPGLAGDFLRGEKEGVPPLSPGDLDGAPALHGRPVLFAVMGAALQQIQLLGARAIGVKGGAVGKEEGELRQAGQALDFLDGALQHLVGPRVGRAMKEAVFLQPGEKEGEKQLAVGL